MTNAISRMSPSVAGGSPYQLDYAALRAAGYVIPEAEAGAVEDYLFDAASTAVLRNRLDGYVLEQGALAVAAPICAAGGVTVDDVYGGLLCRAVDQTEMTVAAIYQRPTATITNAAMIVGTDIVNTASGWSVYTTDVGALVLRIRPGADGPAILSSIAGPLVPKGSWAFIAATISANETTIYLGAGGVLYKASSTSVSRALGGVVSIGKSSNTVTSYYQIDMAYRRAVVWGSALSEADVLQAYKRAQVVSARRGWGLV